MNCAGSFRLVAAPFLRLTANWPPSMCSRSRPGASRRPAASTRPGTLRGERDHLGAARRVVALALFRAAGLGNDVGAVQRVVQRAQRAFRRVERVARVQVSARPVADRPAARVPRRPWWSVAFAPAGGGHQVADLLEEAAVGPPCRGSGPGWPGARCPARFAGGRARPAARRSSARGSATMRSKPFQNAALGTPVPGSTLSSMKRYSSVAHLQAMDGGALCHVFLSWRRCGRNQKKAKTSRRLETGARGLGAQFLERQLVAVDPERAIAVPGRGQRVPAVAADEGDLPRLRRVARVPMPYASGMGLVLTHAVDAEHVIEQVFQAGAAHRRCPASPGRHWRGCR